MSSKLNTVLATVLKKITPNEKEKREVSSLAETLVKKVRAAAKEARLDAKIRVEGSVAKDTWLKTEPEIDIFMQSPPSTPREMFGTVCLDVAKKATKDSKQVERFAEHPYLEAVIGATLVNIVPCYRAKPGEWLSATDRTPYHTDFVLPRLNDKLRSEIRLLKRFMKGINVYGAEIKVGGFSGYLCELLVLHYGRFFDVLKAGAGWREPWIVDYLDYYEGREDEIPKIFGEPLVVVDPVDRVRNVASAVRMERLIEFVAASREFLKSPDEQFFYPQALKAFTSTRMLEETRRRGTAIVFVLFGRVRAVPDIFWGQLYKTQRSLRKMLNQNDFTVVNDAVWSDEKALNLLLFEVESRYLPSLEKHIGPPVEKSSECERFLQKHLAASSTVSGPRLENDRWVVDIRRKHTDIVNLIKEKLSDGGRQVGVADLISKAMTKSLDIRVNGEISRTYLSNKDFAQFLTRYLIGKPQWLTVP